MSHSGFINWAWSSDPAWKAGAFFRTKRDVIPIPGGTLAADNSVRIEREGKEVPATFWFKHSEQGITLREMKLYMEQFDCTLTFLILPKLAEFWPPFGRTPAVCLPVHG
jgi:hypothetical protein